MAISGLPGPQCNGPRGHSRASAHSSWRSSESLKQTIAWEQTSVTSEPNTDGKAGPAARARRLGLGLSTAARGGQRQHLGCQSIKEKRKCFLQVWKHRDQSWLPLQEQPDFSGKSPRRHKGGRRYSVSRETQPGQHLGQLQPQLPGDGKESPPLPFRTCLGCRPGPGANRAESSPCSPTGHTPSAVEGRAPPPVSPAQGRWVFVPFLRGTKALTSTPGARPAFSLPPVPERCAISGQER